MASKSFLTVAEAAIRVNKSRQTLFDKIKRGQLSATVNSDGVKVIDVSELIRVFGTLLSDSEVKQNQANKTVQSGVIPVTTALQTELELAKLKLKHAERELEIANERLQEMKARERQSIEDRTQLLNVIERQTLLLAAPKPTANPRAKVAPKAPPMTPKTAARASSAKPTTPTKSVANVTTRSKPTAKKK